FSFASAKRVARDDYSRSQYHGISTGLDSIRRYLRIGFLLHALDPRGLWHETAGTGYRPLQLFRGRKPFIVTRKRHGYGDSLNFETAEKPCHGSLEWRGERRVDPVPAKPPRLDGLGC